MRHALAALFALGCYAEPPPPAMPGELTGCHPGAYDTLSELRCARDSDCLLCGEGCGELTTRARLAITNAPCPAIDDERCGLARAACCEGRCVRSLGPPSFR